MKTPSGEISELLGPARAKARRTDREAKREESRREAEHDARLVERVRAGDTAAFEEIVARHRDKMFAVALGLLRDRHDAEEIVQDTFIRAHRGLARFRGECSLATWLHRITVNLARNRYWYFHRRSRHTTLSLDRPLGEESDATFKDLLPAAESGPAREASTGEFIELVAVCMDRLEPAHREILTLRNILNQSYDEIAQALGIEVGTVKSRIARARGNLRSLMSAACPEFGEEAEPTDWLELSHGRISGRWQMAV